MLRYKKITADGQETDENDVRTGAKKARLSAIMTAMIHIEHLLNFHIAYDFTSKEPLI